MLGYKGMDTEAGNSTSHDIFSNQSLHTSCPGDHWRGQQTLCRHVFNADGPNEAAAAAAAAAAAGNVSLNYHMSSGNFCWAHRGEPI